MLQAPQILGEFISYGVSLFLSLPRNEYADFKYKYAILLAILDHLYLNHFL